MDQINEQEDKNRAAFSLISQDQKIQDLEKQLVDYKLKGRAIREALQNAKSLDQMDQVKWRLLVVERILTDDQEFFEYWKHHVEIIDRRSNITG
jgi:hypothetical protein